jgi:tetratricopeptide (TPR) repeat protein
MREGYVLTGYFAEALVAYEKQETALRLELGDLIENINVRKERARIEAVQFFDQPVERRVKVQAEAPAPASPLVAQLDAADKLIRAHDLAGARGLCRQVLEQTAPEAVQARAYFDLGKIAALEKDPELSRQLFEKTLSLQAEPFEAAWSHVYLARLAMNAQEPDEAIGQYTAALAVAGGSEQARQAAQTEMEAARSRQQK